MTPLALRLSRRRNGVSELHGAVARGDVAAHVPRTSATVPITHVTNGAHLPTFLGASSAGCSTGTSARAGWAMSPTRARWEAVRSIPTRSSGRRAATARARAASSTSALKQQQDGLLRGEQVDYVRAIAESIDPDVLTIGFARRLATYKRLDLLAHDPERLRALVAGDRPVQILIAGKAHPSDEGGKDTLQQLFRLKRERGMAQRIVFVEDYDLDVARTARRRLRRLGQPAAPADGGERHERDEGGVQRRAPAQRARRLVGGGVRRH